VSDYVCMLTIMVNYTLLGLFWMHLYSSQSMYVGMNRGKIKLIYIPIHSNIYGLS